MCCLDIGRNIDELMRKFKANLHISRKTNTACPSKWKDDGDVDLQPGAELGQRIADVLAVEVEGLHADPQPDEPVDLPDLTAEEAQLLTILRSLNPIARARLTGFALGLAGQTESQSPGA